MQKVVVDGLDSVRADGRSSCSWLVNHERDKISVLPLVQIKGPVSAQLPDLTPCSTFHVFELPFTASLDLVRLVNTRCCEC